MFTKYYARISKLNMKIEVRAGSRDEAAQYITTRYALNESDKVYISRDNKEWYEFKIKLVPEVYFTKIIPEEGEEEVLFV